MKTTAIKLLTFLLAIAVAFGVIVIVTFAPSSRVLADEGALADGELRIHFIDCGQADSCLIQLPDGKNMLIDAGADLETKAESYNKIITYLDQTVKGEKLDYVIMTHADYDHIGGITNVLKGREIGTVYRPSQLAYNDNDETYKDPALSKTDIKEKIPYDTSSVAKSKMQGSATYRNALAYCYENAEHVYVTNPAIDEINHIEGSATAKGETFTYTFDFYSPIEPPFSDNNDYSPIMVLSYANRNIVLSGDAEKENEKQFVQKVKSATTDERYDRFRTNDFNADIIKMGHHGSSTSSSEDYLKIMCTSTSWRANVYTIFSCDDATNNYAHPHSETLQRLMDLRFSSERIERTDIFGDIRFDIKSDGAMTRYRGHKYTVGNTEYDDDAPETLKAVLTSGNSGTRPAKVIEDNGVKPTEKNGSGVLNKPTSGDNNENPFLAWLKSLPIWALVLIGIAIVVIIILIIVLFVRANKKKKSKRR